MHAKITKVSVDNGDGSSVFRLVFMCSTPHTRLSLSHTVENEFAIFFIFFSLFLSLYTGMKYERPHLCTDFYFARALTNDPFEWPKEKLKKQTVTT